MHLARSAERGIELFVERVAGFIFPGQLHPNELGARLVRAADLQLSSSPFGDEAPNWFQIRVNPEELTTDVPVAALETTLATAMEAHSADRGWRLVGPVVVAFDLDESISRGKVSVVAEAQSGVRGAWVLLEGVGQVLAVSNNRAVVGRGDSCDVEIADDTVSRMHALIYRENGTMWLQDLDSANGTFCGPRRVTTPQEVRIGETLTFGSASFQLALPNEVGVEA